MRKNGEAFAAVLHVLKNHFTGALWRHQLQEEKPRMLHWQGSTGSLPAGCSHALLNNGGSF